MHLDNRGHLDNLEKIEYLKTCRDVNRYIKSRYSIECETCRTYRVFEEPIGYMAYRTYGIYI